MYEQIISILKQNHLPNENIFYQDNLGSWIFNNNEDYEEYILDKDEKSGAFLWLLQNEKERSFTIVNGLNLNGIIVYILREETNNE